MKKCSNCNSETSLRWWYVLCWLCTSCKHLANRIKPDLRQMLDIAEGKLEMTKEFKLKERGK